MIIANNITNDFINRFVESAPNTVFLPQEISALTFLYGQLRALRLLEKFIAIYPFVGRSAEAHSLNFINPLSYKISWNNPITHNRLGITGGGGWGNTNVPLKLFYNKLNNIHISAYNSTPIASSIFDGRLIGVNTLDILTNYMDSGAQELNFNTVNGGIIGYVYSEYNKLGGYGFKQGESITNNGRGFMLGNNSSTCYLNGALFGNWQPLLPTQIHRNCPRTFILLGNRYELNVTSAARVSLSFASIGYGLNNLEASLLNNIIDNFQRILGRAVM